MSGAKAEFFRTREADSLLASRTEHVDGRVRDAHKGLLESTPAAVLAVGGYGRKQLFPYSDIDLLILFENNRAVEGSKKALSPFLQLLWDSGLKVSQSVRTRSHS